MSKATVSISPKSVLSALHKIDYHLSGIKVVEEEEALDFVEKLGRNYLDTDRAKDPDFVQRFIKIVNREIGELAKDAKTLAEAIIRMLVKMYPDINERYPFRLG